MRHQQHKCFINLAPSTKYFVFMSAAHVHTSTLWSVTGREVCPKEKKPQADRDISTQTFETI